MTYQGNPLNLRYAARNNWVGQVAPRNGFCQFRAPVYGVRAALITICRSYRRRGIKTVRQLISTYAPPTENQTKVYIDYICGAVGVSPDDDFLAGGLYMLISAMCRIESGYKLSPEEFTEALKLSKLSSNETTYQPQATARHT